MKGKMRKGQEKKSLVPKAIKMTGKKDERVGFVKHPKRA